MDPEDSPATSDQSSAGQLQHVAVFLETAFDADGASGCLGQGAPALALGRGKQDAPPVGALEAHGAVALALGIGYADGFDAVAAAEAGHFGGSSLHHAAHTDAAFGELGERLAQLRKGF